MQGKTIRIGTRGSPLALAQARDVERRLKAAHGLNDAATEICIIKTTGDRIQDRPLAELGGKGLFTKEIEEALLADEIDLAVHSMKDVPTVLPDGLTISAILEREDVRDAFISLKYAGLGSVPPGGIIGTSSLRRQAQVKRLRPDLQVIGFRGNVETRLRKIEEGVADATFLACAGLNRLGLANRITARMEENEMLPAVAQGAVGIEIRDGDQRTAALVAPLNHAPSAVCVLAERAFLRRLEGSCRTPIAGLARLDRERLNFHGMTLSPDGVQCLFAERSGTISDAARLGEDAAADVLSRGALDFLSRAG